MTIKLLGIDLAKNVFQLHGVDEKGKVTLRRQLTRAKLSLFVAKLTQCVIVMEACGGANYWARLFQQYGHEVKLISPQYVKPFVKSNKNDRNDAEAIVEAASRPSMRYVPIKQEEQQDIQSLHRVRERLIHQRTSIGNQLRGFLAEYGKVIEKGLKQVRLAVPLLLGDDTNNLTVLGRRVVADLYEQLLWVDKKIVEYDKHLEHLFSTNEACERIGKIEGVGPVSATAIVAALGDGKVFKNGRQVSSWLGLVPRQHSSGGKERLLGISKRGDSYLRKLLIHGARAVIHKVGPKTDPRSLWIKATVARCGHNKACVALANKNARIIWAVIAKNESYRAVA